MRQSRLGRAGWAERVASARVQPWRGPGVSRHRGGLRGCSGGARGPSGQEAEPQAPAGSGAVVRVWDLFCTQRSHWRAFPGEPEGRFLGAGSRCGIRGGGRRGDSAEVPEWPGEPRNWRPGQRDGEKRPNSGGFWRRRCQDLLTERLCDCGRQEKETRRVTPDLGLSGCGTAEEPRWDGGQRAQPGDSDRPFSMPPHWMSWE